MGIRVFISHVSIRISLLPKMSLFLSNLGFVNDFLFKKIISHYQQVNTKCDETFFFNFVFVLKTLYDFLKFLWYCFK